MAGLGLQMLVLPVAVDFLAIAGDFGDAVRPASCVGRSRPMHPQMVVHVAFPHLQSMSMLGPALAACLAVWVILVAYHCLPWLKDVINRRGYESEDLQRLRYLWHCFCTRFAAGLLWKQQSLLSLPRRTLIVIVVAC